MKSRGTRLPVNGTGPLLPLPVLRERAAERAGRLIAGLALSRRRTLSPALSLRTGRGRMVTRENLSLTPARPQSSCVRGSFRYIHVDAVCPSRDPVCAPARLDDRAVHGHVA